MGFEINRKIFCDLTIGNLNATPGNGIYRLQVTLLLVVNNLDEQELPGALTELEGDLKFNNRPFCRLRVYDPPLHIQQYKHTNKTQTDLYADLSRAQIEAIENSRGSGEIHFNLRIRGRLVTPAVVSKKEKPGEFHVDHATHTAWEDKSFSINQSTWVGLLDQWNYTDTLLVELAIPKSAPQKLTDGLAYFRRAQGAMLRGDFKEVIRDCRCVLDTISEMMEKTHDERRESMIKMLEKKRDAKKEDRFLLLRKALSHVCDPSHHGDTVSNSIDWQRSDAVAVLAATSAILLKVFE